MLLWSLRLGTLGKPPNFLESQFDHPRDRGESQTDFAHKAMQVVCELKRGSPRGCGETRLPGQHQDERRLPSRRSSDFPLVTGRKCGSQSGEPRLPLELFACQGVRPRVSLKSDFSRGTGTLQIATPHFKFNQWFYIC